MNRGKQVLSIGPFDTVRDIGPCHGIKRIIRLAYDGHSSNVPLVQRAFEL